jgi:hypothetical protein
MKPIALGAAKVIAAFCLAIIGMEVAHFVMIDEEWIFALLVVAGFLYLNFGQERDAK